MKSLSSVIIAVFILLVFACGSSEEVKTLPENPIKVDLPDTHTQKTDTIPLVIDTLKKNSVQTKTKPQDKPIKQDKMVLKYDAVIELYYIIFIECKPSVSIDNYEDRVSILSRRKHTWLYSGPRYHEEYQDSELKELLDLERKLTKLRKTCEKWQ